MALPPDPRRLFVYDIRPLGLRIEARTYWIIWAAWREHHVTPREALHLMVANRIRPDDRKALR